MLDNFAFENIVIYIFIGFALFFVLLAVLIGRNMKYQFKRQILELKSLEVYNRQKQSQLKTNFEHMLSLLPDAFIVLDKRGVLIFTNGVAQTLFSPGWTRGFHFRKAINKLPEAAQKIFAQTQEKWTQRGVSDFLEYEVLYQHDESSQPLALKLLLSQDRLGRLLIVFKDISSEKKLSYELADLKEQQAQMQRHYELSTEVIKKELEIVEEKRKKVETEASMSHVAKRVFLPKICAQHLGLDSSGSTFPSPTGNGGDWWETISLANKYYVIIGRMSAKGSLNSLFTAAISGYFASMKRKILNSEEADVCDILQELDAIIFSFADQGLKLSMSCFVCMFDFEHSLIRFANAGHAYPIIIRGNKKAEALVANGLSLGTGSGVTSFEKKEAPLHPEDFIIFYSEGLVQMKNEGEEYGKRRLRKFVEAHNMQPCATFVDYLITDAIDFYGKKDLFEDDVTLVAVKIKKMYNTAAKAF